MTAMVRAAATMSESKILQPDPPPSATGTSTLHSDSKSNAGKTGRPIPTPNMITAERKL